MYNFILLIILIFIAIKKSKFSYLSPIAIFVAGLMIMYVLRPIYILSYKKWGASILDIYNINGYESLLFQSLLISSAYITVIFIILLVFLQSFKFNKQKSFYYGFETSKIVNRTYYILLIFSISAFLIPFIRGLSIEAFLQLLAVRSLMFKEFYGEFGNYINLFIYMFYSVAILKIAQNIQKGRRIGHIVFIVVILLMLLGGRSNVLFFFISVGLLKNYMSKPINTSVIFLSMIGFILFTIVYRVATRDIYFRGNVDKDFSEVMSENLINSFGFIVGGPDFAQLDALMEIVEDERLESGYLYGSTIIACLASPIPRAIWPEKPKGAMSEFTKLYYPRHFKRANGGEFISSWLGECIMSFGFIGVLIAGISVSWFCIYIEKGLVHSNSLYSFVIFCILVPRPFNIAKSDLFNNFINIGQTTLIPILIMIYFNIFLRNYIKKKRAQSGVIPSKCKT
jgi:oligosaccharide repeat unit polymerase